jgi:hypothetical protein
MPNTPYDMTCCKMCFQLADSSSIKIDQRGCNTVVQLFFACYKFPFTFYHSSCLLIMSLSSFSYSAPVYVDIEYTVGKAHTLYRKVTLLTPSWNILSFQTHKRMLAYFACLYVMPTLIWTLNTCYMHSCKENSHTFDFFFSPVKFHHCNNAYYASKLCLCVEWKGWSWTSEIWLVFYGFDS